MPESPPQRAATSPAEQPSADASIALLHERIRSLDALLQQTLDSWSWPVSLQQGPVICSGAGGSEGPARYLAARLAGQGRAARFLPLTAFEQAAGTVHRAAAKGSLVVFSQGLSRNARIALARHAEYHQTVVLSALEPAAEPNTANRPGAADQEPRRYLRQLMTRGVQLVRHAPAQESGLLVRVVGPAIATLLAELLSAPPTQRDAVIAQCRRALTARKQLSHLMTNAEAPTPPWLAAAKDWNSAPHHLALLTIGDYQPYAHGLRWKLLEGLGDRDPSVWDALQFAHGPLQAIYPQDASLLLLTNQQRPGGLAARLAAVLNPQRHPLRTLHATMPQPLSWFEHDAMLNELLLAALQQQPRDLANWPAKGNDAPLYEYAGTTPPPSSA